MRNLSLRRRHLVNAYEVEAGIGVIAGNTVIHAWAPWVWGTTKSALYKYTYLLPFIHLVGYGTSLVKERSCRSALVNSKSGLDCSLTSLLQERSRKNKMAT